MSNNLVVFGRFRIALVISLKTRIKRAKKSFSHSFPPNDMAIVASSSSSVVINNEVFISFRLVDTHKNFIHHLYSALYQKGIRTYIDGPNLERGDEILLALFRAIEESMISIVVFSKEYASCRWCLDELVHIIKCKNERDQIVLPVFYNIDPSDIRKQKGSYAIAFAAHEKSFEPRKVMEWRNALTAAADLSGFHSQDQYESELIEKIVKDVLRKLKRLPQLSFYTKGLVGIDQQLEEIESLLCFGLPNPHVIGLWGLGGIGKTTLAVEIFNRFSYQFENRCFLENVRENSEKHGLSYLETKLFSNLMEERDLESPVYSFVRNRLHNKTMLIVLDDVDDIRQLDYLLGDGSWFGPGSKVIITTRDAQLLIKNADLIHQVKPLDFEKALELFYLNAFKTKPSITRFIELSEAIVTYTGGNPLALKILGSFLHSQAVEYWEHTWNKLKIIPHSDIQKVLKISYDGLDDTERDILNLNLKDLVGIHKHFEKIESSLCIGSPNILVVGICGMSGIGKTTLASFLFSQLSSQFEGSSFLANISEGSKTHGLVKLQNKLLGELFEEENLDYMGIISSRSAIYKERLHRKKVLVVLDDINNSNQFRVLAREHDLFDLGSRIIVTTRDMQVLKNIKANEEYCLGELNYDEALQLFQLNARNSPRTGSVQLNRVVNCAKGIPLALKVLGSYLRNKNEAEWENVVTKLEKVPDILIPNLLKICYDGLDDEEKEIFLDIACFFKGEDRYFIERSQKVFDSSTTIRINNLIAKSLITIEHHVKLSMHDLVQEMGWEIGRQRSVKKLGSRSRLWNAEDIYHVLKDDEGSSSVQVISLDMSHIAELDLSPTVFSKMCNLRFLKIYNSNDDMKKCKVCLPHGLEPLPGALRYLHWDEYPLKHLPLKFCYNNLVELIVRNSEVEQLWDGVQHLAHLRKIDLSYSEHLTQIPDLSMAPNLEIINFQCCISLVQGPSAFLHLDKLRSLNLDGCSSINEFPEFSTNVRYLDLSGTAINRIMISLSISSSSHLETLNLKHCKGLMDLPTCICELTHLKHFNLSGCSTLKSFPDIMKPMECLRVLKLERTAIGELPSSIENLIGLETLSLEMCENLKSVPSSIINLSSLKELSLRHCLKLQTLPELPLWLKNLDAEGCSSLKTVSSSRFRIATRQGLDNLQHCGGKFDFINCQELGQNARSNIMTDALSRMLHMALFSSKDIKGRHTRLHEIWFPGNEVSKCFIYRFVGCSGLVSLPPNWCNSNFLGFIICAVVDFKQCQMDENFLFHFQFRLPVDLRSTVAANDTCSTFSWNKSNGLVNSDHVLTFYYYNRDWFSSTCDNVTQASFQFYSNNECCKVKGFGVRHLYAQEAETMFNSITQDVGTSMVLESTDSIAICNEPEPIVTGTHEDADIMDMEDETEEKGNCGCLMFLCQMIGENLNWWSRKPSKGRRSRENVAESSSASQRETELNRILEEQQRLMEEQQANIAQLSHYLSQVIPGIQLPFQPRRNSYQDQPQLL